MPSIVKLCPAQQSCAQHNIVVLGSDLLLLHVILAIELKLVDVANFLAKLTGTISIVVPVSFAKKLATSTSC